MPELNYTEFTFGQSWPFFLPLILMLYLTFQQTVLGLFFKTRPALLKVSHQLNWFLFLGAVLIAGYGLFHFPHTALSDTFFKIDTLTIFSTALVMFLGLPWFAALMKACTAGQLKFEGIIFYALSLSGLFVMISANHFLSLYLGLELHALSLYALIVLHQHHQGADEAGFKYFTLGAIASAFILFGIALVYGASHSLSFSLGGVPISSDMKILLDIGYIFVFAGMAFKLALVPFHMWVPDVYAGVNNTIAGILATLTKVGAVILFVRLMGLPFKSLFESGVHYFTAVAIASLLVGALAGLRQKHLRRLMAYSGIGQLGFLALGFLAPAEQNGAILLYMMAYTLSAALFFSVLSSLAKKEGDALSQISDLAGLGRQYPVAAFMLATALFSMAGIPPMAGFWGKLTILMNIIQAGHQGVAVVAVLASAVAAYYYLKLIKIMYFDETGSSLMMDKQAQPINILLCAAVLGFVLYMPFVEPLLKTIAHLVVLP